MHGLNTSYSRFQHGSVLCILYIAGLTRHTAIRARVHRTLMTCNCTLHAIHLLHLLVCPPHGPLQQSWMPSVGCECIRQNTAYLVRHASKVDVVSIMLESRVRRPQSGCSSERRRINGEPYEPPLQILLLPVSSHSGQTPQSVIQRCADPRLFIQYDVLSLLQSYLCHSD